MRTSLGWLGIRVTTLLLLFAAICSAEDPKNSPLPEALQSALEAVLADPASAAEPRLELVAQIDQALTEAEVQSGETWIKTRFVEALTNMQLNRLELSQQQLEALTAKIDRQAFPEMWFRVHSLDAAILLMRGEREASLRAHENLLSSPGKEIAETLVDRARANYAEALRETGSVTEAADLYEAIMLPAIERQADTTALQSGNNLTSILLDQGDLLAARHTLDALQPIRMRNPQKLGSLSLLLQESQLNAMEGDIDEAITGLQEFLSAQPKPPQLLRGAAYRQLAEALCEQGDLEQALVCSRTAVELMSDRPNKLTDARLTLAQTLILGQDFAGAIDELNKIDESEVTEPARRKLASRLRLEAQLRLDGRDREIEVFDAMVAADRLLDRQISKSRADYLDARLTAAQRNLELQQAEAATTAALERNRVERRYRNVLLGLVSTVALASCLSIFLVFKRRSAQLLLKEQASRNERLAALVDAKTEELRNNLKTRAELMEALEKKKRTEAIGLLAGNVAHDLNNLFQVIVSTNECLSNPTSSPEQRSQFLAVSNESLRHGAGIVKQLLAYSRKQELVVTSTRFSDYLSSTEALFRSAIGERTKLTISDESAGAFVLIDTSQMTAALLNIFINAVDAMPEGGAITLVASRCEVGDEGCSWSDLNQNKFLALSVRDCGFGMNAEQVSRAFEPFYSTKTAESGTGLGLSSVQGFVKKSGGDIRILSVENEGTEIQILLPLTQAEVAKPQVLPSYHSVAEQNRRMLLVEDNEEVAKSLLKLLSHLGFRTEWAACGEDAIKLLAEDEEFDFVLSDVRMPGGMDGLTLAHWINEEKAGLPVFLMSGYSELPSGDFHFPLIAKPFNVEQLREFLQQFFDGQSKDQPTAESSQNNRENSGSIPG